MNKTPKEYVEDLMLQYLSIPTFKRNEMFIGINSGAIAKECAKICIGELQKTERKYGNYGMVVYYDECLKELNNL